MKTKLFVFLLAIIATLSIGLVSAVNLEITSLDINRHTVSSTDTSANRYFYERGEALELSVCVRALAEVRDAQITAFIAGYDYANDEPSKIRDMTDTFNLLTLNDVRCYDLNLEVPTLIDKDSFKLRVEAYDRNGAIVPKEYQLYLNGINRKNAIEIKDFSLDPQTIIAGRAFTGKVQIHNLYTDTIKDLKLTMSIPALNKQVSEYMDEIDTDKSKTFEELQLRIDDCTKAGTYNVDITVDYDNFKQTETTGTITVASGDTCGATSTTTPTEKNTVVSVPNSQEVSQGTSIVYPIVISNTAATAQTYTLSVTGASTWATTRIDPSAVLVVPAGSSKTAYLYVGTNANAELGDKPFTLTIESGTDTKSVPLVAKITKTTSNNFSGFTQALEIGLVILVVILIIVGLVIGFNKMKENKNESEPYY